MQGDLPTIEPQAVRARSPPLAEPRSTSRRWRRRSRDAEERDDPNVVKAVGTPIGAGRLRALYFTRATAPWGAGALLHHIGLYAYRRAALERFVALPPSPLELRERLEQLRALEAGMRIDIALVDVVPLGVDTPDDLARARERLTPVKEPAMTSRTIAYQGEPGANSHIACVENFPDWTSRCPARPSRTPSRPLRDGAADLGMIPIENSIAGRVADIHTSAAGFGPAHHRRDFPADPFPAARACRARRISDLRSVHSHVHALGQCRKIIRELGLKPVVAGDTAGSAREVAGGRRSARAPRWRPSLAGEIYGLEVLREDVEDEAHNTTRFVVLSKTPEMGAGRRRGRWSTTFVFRVRNVPAALYKALGGFATNGVNMTKLESYMVDGEFTATQFLADVDGHPDDPPLARALEELAFFSREVRILGVYPAHPFRQLVT